MQIGQRLGAHGTPHHDLSRLLRHLTAWNGSPYAVVLGIKRMLQLKHGPVTPDDPTKVLCRPVSQLLAERNAFLLFFGCF